MSSQPFYVNEIFWGIMGIIGIGIAVIVEMRKSRGLFSDVLDSIRGSIQGGVDEKISVLYRYTSEVPKWRENKVNEKLMISRIISDVNSIARVRNRIAWEQWRELHKALIELRNAMETAGIDTIDIDAIREALR